jgi:protoporphyrinogen oxidase
MASRDTHVVCLGAGPAGLTAGYLLAKKAVPVTVVEKDPVYVGGIARTATYRGFRFDIGGHRFFSKSKEVEDLWTEILGDDLLTRSRKSRIYYNNQLFDYPLRARDALMKLGPVEAVACVASYLKASCFPIRAPKNFEEWVSNQFGRRLFDIFFRTYTEKVWGVKCTEISADWAAQRVKGLSLGSAIWHSIFPQRVRDDQLGEIVKTLIDRFRYPRQGPGMMWETAAEKMQAMGGVLTMDAAAAGLSFDQTRKAWNVTVRNSAGAEQTIAASHVISSIPMQELVGALNPRPSERTRQAAQLLKYRDFLIVALIIKDRQQFDDNWIYVHDPKVKVGRIQNFKAWSPDLVPDADRNCLGMEYFCFEGDGLWNAPDDALRAMAADELVTLGLAERADILDGCVIRQPKAYPVYDANYQKHVDTIRDEIERDYPNLYLVGRNGMHKYNNQDHAMMTAMLSVENIVAGRKLFDPWRVNQDAIYHEAGEAGAETSLQRRRWRAGERAVPEISRGGT